MDIFNEIKLNNIDYVKEYIKSGKDINIIHPTMSIPVTPLYAALLFSQYEIAQLLLDNGADVNLGRPILSVIKTDNYIKVINMLITHNVNLNVLTNNNETPLITAIKQNNLEIVNLLIENGADVNFFIAKEHIPLITAIQKKNIEITSLLIKKGAIVNYLDSYYTPLVFACTENNTELIKLLIDNGAKIHAKDNKNVSAFIKSCENNNIEIIKLFIKLGIDINEKDHNINALYFVCKTNSIETLHLLIENGINITENCAINTTPLMLAIEYFHIDIVKILIINGALTSDIKKQLFYKYYINILNTCFLDYTLSSEYEQVKFYIELIFVLDFKQFKIFAIQYLFVHNSYNIISNYYEDKTYKLYFDDTNNTTIFRVYNKYDIPLNDENVFKIIYEIHKDSIEYMYVPYKIYDVNDSFKFIEDITDPENHMNEKYKKITSVFDFETDPDKSFNVFPRRDLQVWKSCLQKFMIENKKLGTEILTYYTHIGDRCIHNILRGREELNTIEYCKKDNQEIHDCIVHLNRFIWNANESSLTCDERIKNIDSIILYRGTKLGNIPLKRGSIINNQRNQFVSFTSKFSVAKSFGDIIFELTLTKNDVILPIEDIKIEGTFISKYAKEMEWLFPINTSFILTGDAYTNTEYIDEYEPDEEDTHTYIIIPIKVYRQEKTEFKIFDNEELQNRDVLLL